MCVGVCTHLTRVWPVPRGLLSPGPPRGGESGEETLCPYTVPTHSGSIPGLPDLSVPCRPWVFPPKHGCKHRDPPPCTLVGWSLGWVRSSRRLPGAGALGRSRVPSQNRRMAGRGEERGVKQKEMERQRTREQDGERKEGPRETERKTQSEGERGAAPGAGGRVQVPRW